MTRLLHNARRGDGCQFSPVGKNSRIQSVQEVPSAQVQVPVLLGVKVPLQMRSPVLHQLGRLMLEGPQRCLLLEETRRGL